MFNWILIIVLYLPFQLALNPSAGIDLASIRILILGLFFLWLAQGLKNKKLLIQSNLQTLFIISFLFLNLVSIFVARNSDWSLRKLIFLFSIFPIYFVVSNVINSQEKFFKTVKTLIFSGTLVACIGLAQFLMQFIIGLRRTYDIWSDYVIVPFLGKTFSQAVLENPSWLVNISGKTYLRATSLFPDPHMFSFFLGLLIPFSFGLAMINKNKIWPIISLIVLLMADLLTFSRGGYLGLLAGALVLIFLFWYKIDKKFKITLLFFSSLLILVLIIPSSFSKRFYSSFDLKEGSNQGRLSMWSKSWEVSLDNPIWGVGIGNYPLEVNPSANYREPIYAHNTYLDIASETGVINALVWIMALVFSLMAFLKKAKKDELFLMGIVSVVIFSAHSIFETGIYSPVVLTLFLIILSFSNINLKNEKIS